MITFTFIIFLFFTSINQSIQNVELAQNRQKLQQDKIICGSVFTEKLFYLQSPDYPENYPSNVNCEYILKNPDECPTYFKLNFLVFRLENSVGCDRDKLIIQDQDVLCGNGPENPEGNAYFSNDGTLNVRFITDGNGTSSGFKILVNRTDCENDIRRTTTDVTETFETSTLEQELSTLPFRPFHLPIQPAHEGKLPHCCLNTYNSRRFLITSPNFPNSLNAKFECAIQIQKANQNICRLRLSFLYFYLGSSNYNNCPYGYLKIDGKLICGCNQELKLTTTFENDNIKNLIFKSDQTNVNSRTGFIIEVIQDECPTKYYPASKNDVNNAKEDYRYIVPRFGEQSYIEQAQLVHQKTEITNNNPSSSKFVNVPKLVKTFYYFTEPDYNALPLEPRENEPTTFIDTTTINSVVTNLNSNECMNWNSFQLQNLLNRYGTNLQTCRRTEDNSDSERRDCVELDYLNGYFKSPGYPFFYPKNLNICYRFRKQTGYCGVRLFMADFKIENSYGCHKDYILLENGNKYCGKRLFGQYLTFDLTYKNHVDMIFVTDTFFCGRGFFGTYRQLHCQTNPDYTTIRPDFTTTTTLRPFPICDRYITDRAFELEVGQDLEKCIFQIRRLSKNVCKINLYLEKFDLFCGSEALELDKMMLCGHLSGRKLSVNFEDNNDLIQIIYQSSLTNKYEDYKFRIFGEQITDDCLFPDPPVQRFVKNS
ncbi:unnamed protein product [Psylliodes chrysocephalus]|uniref:CUB domain-containing protein n=1 Tax=Psylliodes chrysocephalus TaxID=3402493 RepID=A0A9P0GK32_9CUCU|nr:unnamed protein product [Psylliodes chrysocephala]